MLRRYARVLSGLGLSAVSGVALACADGGCEGGFNLKAPSYSCRGMGMLAPGNDSRINLMFLLADRGGRSSTGLSYSKPNYDMETYGTVFLDWASLTAALFPGTTDPEDVSYAGSRCAGYAAGTTALDAAMAANRGLPDSDRDMLTAARRKAEDVCRQGTDPARWRSDPARRPVLTAFDVWPQVSTLPGREFLGYLKASDAFYGERWDEARQGYAALSAARDPWLRETAAYMLIRTEFAAAQGPAFGAYGDYDEDKVDRAAVKRGLLALSAYLKAWPAGRYSASALGLLRRGLWLAGDYAALGQTYAKMLDVAPVQDEAALELVQEIDNKLLFNRAAANSAPHGPMLLAVHDLVALRDDGDTDKPLLSAAALAAQAPLFAGQPDLFGYLQATQAFYHAKDYRRVLTLIPDDTRHAGASNLAFSRQVLRGMALAGLDDRNEAAFWQQLLGTATGLWQRPLVELALALNWERNGKVAAVFAAGSPITEPTLRNILIVNSATPDLLRRIAQDGRLDAQERDAALYTLLAGELGRGLYAPFAADTTLPLAGTEPTAAIFTKGKVDDGSYPCAPIATSARALAANPADNAAKLCVGEFFRLNGIGSMGEWSHTVPDKDELGGHARGFTPKLIGRASLYDSVIADPRARPEDKAYALYRAVMCYAPSGSSECGAEQVPVTQRKAWHDQLKRDHAASPWAKKLRYYW